MILILEIAAGILLAFGLLKLPTIYRRRKVENFYLSLEPVDVFEQIRRTDIYTDAQRALLISLSVAQSHEKRKEIASQLAHSFAEK